MGIATGEAEPRAVLAQGTALITADIGRPTEKRLARSGPLQCAVLVVPHHGGRSSTSPSLLDATAPGSGTFTTAYTMAAPAVVAGDMSTQPMAGSS